MAGNCRDACAHGPARPGDSVSLSIKGTSKDAKMNPRDTVYIEKDGDLKPIKTFTVIVAVPEHPTVPSATPPCGLLRIAFPSPLPVLISA